MTNAPLVPPLVLFLTKHPLVDKFDLSSLKSLSSGAAPLGRDLEIGVSKRLPNLESVRQGLCIFVPNIKYCETTNVLSRHPGKYKSDSVSIQLRCLLQVCVSLETQE